MNSPTSCYCLVLIALTVISPSVCKYEPWQAAQDQQYPLVQDNDGYLQNFEGEEEFKVEDQAHFDDEQNTMEEDVNAEQQQSTELQQSAGYTKRLEAGKTYVLMGINGRFVSRIRRGSVDYMEAEKQTIDLYTRLQASVLYNGKVSFRSDNGGYKYLSRYSRGGVQDVEAAKSAIDIYSEFAVEIVKQNGVHFIYLKADNGLYVGVRRRGGRNNIEAIYKTKIGLTRFMLLEL